MVGVLRPQMRDLECQAEKSELIVWATRSLRGWRGKGGTRLLLRPFCSSWSEIQFIPAVIRHGLHAWCGKDVDSVPGSSQVGVKEPWASVSVTGGAQCIEKSGEEEEESKLCSSK